MADMTSKERVMCALAGEKPDRVPFAEPPVDPKVLTALFGDKGLTDPIFVADALGIDILCFSFMPPLFVEEVVLPDGRTHQTSGKLHTRADLKLLETLEDPTDDALYADLDRLVSKAGDRAVMGMSRLGLSSTLLSMDLTGFSYALTDDPELITIILRRYLQWASIAVNEMCKRGVDFLWFFDDIAYHSGPMMSPEVLRDFLLPEIAKLTLDLPLPWVYHSDGDLRPVMEDLLSLGMSAIHPIEPESMDLKELKQQIGARVCLVGNVSVDVLARGTKEQMRAEVRRCLEEGPPGGGYMISSSNSIPSYAKPENVLVMVDAIRKYNTH